MHKAAVAEQKYVTDLYGRIFKTLRISLTNACNFSCSYCVSPENTKEKRSVNLSNEELIYLTKKITEFAPIETVRLTGGEPLLYPHLPELVKGLKTIGIEKVKITTNGYLLEKSLPDLIDAGLDSINISLDSITEDTFRKISKRNNVHTIINAINSAVDSGLEVKINSVILKGINEHEIIPILEYATEKKISIRFLELMKMGHLYYNHQNYFVSEEQMLDIISEQYKITPIKRTPGATAKYWKTDVNGTFGIISNISDSFCGDCNRLRLDSSGKIYGCLSSDAGIDIRNNTEESLFEKMQIAISQKKLKFTGSPLKMISIGG